MSENKQYKRLQILRQRLYSGDYFTSQKLAEELGISLRTLNRDIQLLREEGLPIEAERGRGGGLQLQQQWSVGRVNLSLHEAIDLLISLAVAEKMGSPIFFGQLDAIRRKVSASFSKDMLPKIRQLRSRLLVSTPATAEVVSGYKHQNNPELSRIHQAFFEKRSLNLHYRDNEGRKTEREIEPHYLVLRFPIWYIFAWDRLRDDVRSFRCDRIEKVTLGSSFQLRKAAEFDRVLEYFSGSI